MNPAGQTRAGSKARERGHKHPARMRFFLFPAEGNRKRRQSEFACTGKSGRILDIADDNNRFGIQIPASNRFVK